MIVHRVSAVFLLRDGFTGRTLPDLSGTFCGLDGFPCRPLWKAGGYLVLTDLSEGEHTLTLRRRGFQECRLRFCSSSGQAAAEPVDLKPGPEYPFPAGTAHVLLRVNGGGEEIWLGASHVARPVLSREEGPASGENLHLFFRGSEALLPLPGHWLLSGPRAPELIFLRSLRGNLAGLSAPLGGTHPRGAELIPVQSFQADEAGSISASFPSPGTLFLFCGGQWAELPLVSGTQELNWETGGRNLSLESPESGTGI